MYYTSYISLKYRLTLKLFFHIQFLHQHPTQKTTVHHAQMVDHQHLEIVNGPNLVVGPNAQNNVALGSKGGIEPLDERQISVVVHVE